MATTFIDYTGDGNATKQFSFPSIKEADIKVDVDGVIKSSGTHYNITGYTTTGGGNVVFTSGNIPVSPAEIRIFRDTDVNSPKATYTAGSSVKAGDLNNNNKQLLYAAQEEQNQTILTSDIKDSAVTSAKIKDGTIVAGDLASNSITETKIVDNAVSMAKLAGGTLPTDITVASANIVDLTIAEADIADGAVTRQKIAADAINSTKIADDSINSEHLVSDSIDTEHYAPNSVDTTALAADAVTGAQIADDAVDSEHLAADSIDAEHYAAASVDATALASNSVVESKITDLNVTTNKIANDAITIGKIGCEQTTITDSDAHIPTSGAVVDYVAAQLEPFGGFEAIADEVSFPNTQPASGVAISIADAAGIVVNGSGTSTTGRTVGGTTVTINNINSQYNNSTVASGIRFIVTSTGSGHVYNYHKSTLPESDLVNLSGDINDFNERYRVGGSNPNTSLDSGDLFFNTGTGKLLVYNGVSSAWEETQTVGNFFINTISSSSGTGGGSATFNGSAYRFTLSNAGTFVQQHLVSINGVIQKPNTGTSQPSEGFAIDGADIIFAAAPATGSDFFIITIGASVSIGAPSAGTVTPTELASNAVTEPKIADGAVTNSKVASGIDASKITGLTTDAITENNSKVEVVDTGTGYVTTVVDGVEKIRTIPTGTTIADYLRVGNNWNIADGTGSGLSFQTSNSNDVITSTAVNGFYIRSDAVSFSQVGHPNNNYGGFSNGGFNAGVNGVNKLLLNSTGFTVSTGILSGTDSTHDIGTNTNRFANVYADNYYGSAANLTAIPAANITGTLPAIDGSNLTGLQAGATGGNSGGNAIFWENDQTVTHDYTISTNKNAGTFGPVTINNGVTVTVPNNSVWTIV